MQKNNFLEVVMDPKIKSALKNLKIDSVDLCLQGANPMADIKLMKSAGQGGRAYGNHTDTCFQKPFGGAKLAKTAVADMIQKANDALGDSFDSITKAVGMTADEKLEAMLNSFDEYQGFLGKSAKELDTVKGGLDPSQMSDEDKETYKALVDRYGDMPDDSDDDDDDDDLNDEPFAAKGKKKCLGSKKKCLDKKKSLDDSDDDEVEELKSQIASLKKSLELKDLKAMAEGYEVVGKSADDVAETLYKLKHTDEDAFNDYVGMMKSQKSQREQIFKTYGSDHAFTIGERSSLDKAVENIRKNDPKLTRAQAIVKAYQLNPDLPEYEN